MVQDPPEIKNFTMVPNSLFFNRNLSMVDRTVLEAIMSVCCSEGPHKISFRQIAGIADVSVSVLSPDEKKGREGVMKKLERIEYITVVYARALDHATGQPKGNAQAYVYVNYHKIWEDNQRYYQEHKAIAPNAFLVADHDFQLIEGQKPVRHANNPARQESNLDRSANDPARIASNPVRGVRSNRPHNTEQTINTSNTKKTSNPLREEWYSHFDEWFRALPGNSQKYKAPRNEKSNTAIDQIITGEMSVEGVKFIFAKMASDSFWRQHLNIPKVVEKYPVWIGEFKPIEAPPENEASTEDQEADNRAVHEAWRKRREASMVKG